MEKSFLVLYAYITGRNMRSIGGSLTEKIAVEVIYILFGVVLTCDELIVQSSLKIIQKLIPVFHTWFSVFPLKFAQVNKKIQSS